MNPPDFTKTSSATIKADLKAVILCSNELGSIPSFSHLKFFVFYLGETGSPEIIRRNIFFVKPEFPTYSYNIGNRFAPTVSI